MLYYPCYCVGLVVSICFLALIVLSLLDLVSFLFIC